MAIYLAASLLGKCKVYEPRKNGTTLPGAHVAHACSLDCWRRDDVEAGNLSFLIASPLVATKMTTAEKASSKRYVSEFRLLLFYSMWA